MAFLNDELLGLADALSTRPLGLSQALGNSVCPDLLSLETAWHFRPWRLRGAATRAGMHEASRGHKSRTLQQSSWPDLSPVGRFAIRHAWPSEEC